MSGGRAKMQARKGKANAAQVGDIGAIDSAGEPLLRKVVIECKFYKDLDITAGLLTERGRLHHFWVELCGDAITVGRKPFLIARQNQLPAMLLTPWETAHELDIMYEPKACLTNWSHQPALFVFDDVVPELKYYSKPKLRRSAMP